MKRKSLFILLSVLILGLTVACMSNSILSNLGSDSTNTSDSQNASNILLQEDFSNSNSGWDVFDKDSYAGNYEDGIYTIINNDTQSYAWGFAHKYFTDTSIEVETHLISGPTDSESGIICREDGDNFYYGLVSVDGYYGIFKSTADDFALVQMENMPYNESINKENAVNKIRFDCIGSSLSLYVNDILLAQVTDSDFTSGDIGLLVGTYDEGAAKFGFDNLVVSNP
jgi:hypothetical protein